MRLDLLSRRLLLERPQRMTEIDAWHGHIPFAFLIVELQRPELIVELGTWRGDSYCAFCQAVATLGLPARCRAVDSWEGDEHTGAIPSEHFEELKTYHDPLYGSFSQLIRCTFDEALEHFADGSVDLLHIDGAHSYEAVEHDFAAWRRKLSTRGVVLLHDVSERQTGFGVWQLWEELSGLFPAFAFTHSHGLGVLAVGDRPDEEVFDFLELATQRESEIRALFTGLGERAALLGKVERLAAKIASKEQEHQRLEEHLQRVSQDAERAREEAVVASNALEEAKGTCDALHGEVARRDRVIADILESRSWRMTRPLREAKASLPAVRAALRPIKRRLLTPGKPPAISVLPCSHRGSDESAAGARQVRVNGPLISIVMPVYNPPRQFLERAIDSVKRQSYPRWELCVCDDGSTSDVVGVVLGNASADDERVRVTRSETNEGISAASNRALDLATGEYVAFLDNDDELAVDALLECANVLADGPEIDILYTDEDKIDANGSRSDPFFKPDWSPNMFRGVMYVGHLLVARRSLVMDVKGFDPRFDTVQDYELMLRLSERTERITHLPKILYHWRKIPGSVAADINAKEAVPRQQVDAVNAHLRRCGIRAVARAHPRLPHRVQLQAEARTDWPPVSVVFASDRPQRARRCLEAILQTTTYPDFEVIVAAPSQTDELQRMSSVKTVVLDKAAFTVPAGVNTAARTADGDILVLLQDNVAGVTPDWLEALVWPLETPRVGAVGPVLTSSGGSVQSAGLVLRPSQHKAFEDALSGFSNDADGFAGSLSCAREVSSVRAACIAVAQSTFSECGGFREDFRAGAYGVDLCLRIRRGGSDVLCAPHAVLTLDGENDDDPMDHALLLDVWREVFKDGDPYYRQELPLSA